MLTTLEHCGVRPFRVEPDCLALVRTAVQRHRLPRKAKTVLHVFLNEVQGLAVLAAATLPIAWRKFALPAGREGPEIFSVQRTLQALERHYGVEAPLDTVMIYGRGDLHARLEEEAADEASGSAVRCHEGPGNGRRRDRLRIGLGVPEPKPAGLRLVASGEAQGDDPGDFPLGGAGFGSRDGDLPGPAALRPGLGARRCPPGGAGGKGPPCCLASTAPAKLEKERNELREKVDAVRRFLATPHPLVGIHARSAGVPAGQCAVRLAARGLRIGEAPERKRASAKPKKSFNLLVTAPVGSKDYDAA